MSEPLTAAALFDALQSKLLLEWAAGESGRDRPIRYRPDDARSRVSLVGHLNFIHPHHIQVLGEAEMNYLDGLRTNSRKDAVKQLFAVTTDVIVLCEDQPLPEDLRIPAEATGVPVWRSPMPGQEAITQIQYYHGGLYAQRATLHGVFMEVMGIGVLITGDPSIGKSELALELVSRGHRLIADDIPEFARIAPDVLSGSCPELLRDFLEVRGLGILNIRALFGDSAIKQSKYLRLIIHLQKMSEEDIRRIDRLRGNRRSREALGVEIPEVTLPVAPGRNLAVLVEAAARTHILAMKGYDASQVFIERQRNQIEKNAP